MLMRWGVYRQVSTSSRVYVLITALAQRRFTLYLVLQSTVTHCMHQLQTHKTARLRPHGGKVSLWRRIPEQNRTRVHADPKGAGRMYGPNTLLTSNLSGLAELPDSITVAVPVVMLPLPPVWSPAIASRLDLSLIHI